jgi:ADP-ribosylglycohydrolase
MNLPEARQSGDTAQSQASFEGLLLGTAVGDALGLAAENLSPDRIRRRWKGEWSMRFFLGRGMISDDTEHTLMVAQALLSHPHEAAGFQRALAWKFRWWFAGLPGGVGLATAKACLKLWLGVPARNCAVPSGGSGPAMRSAILGAYFADDAPRRREFVRASSQLTHRGWQAETAALAVAEAAAVAVSGRRSTDVRPMFRAFRELSPEVEWQQRLSQMESALGRNDSVSDFAHTLGLEKGVSGYSLHVVPVALYAWLRHPGDFRSAVVAALDCGGDTDTVGAILGALCGASGGPQGIPHEWIDGLAEWPRSVAFIRAVARRLAEQRESGRPLGELSYFWPGLIPRNMFFLVVVILHGLRRLLPPY